MIVILKADCRAVKTPASQVESALPARSNPLKAKANVVFRCDKKHTKFMPSTFEANAICILTVTDMRVVNNEKVSSTAESPKAKNVLKKAQKREYVLGKNPTES